MNRRLILYWYVPRNLWHPLYDLHLANLRFYASRFDSTDLVIAKDQDTPEEYIKATLDRLMPTLPAVDLSFWPNDPIKREGDYFCREVIGNLEKYSSDTACFFAHNKGAGSSYMTQTGIRHWINFMYFANLYKIGRIQAYLDQPETITIGSITVPGTPWPWLKYNWHYSGTFFWFIPERLKAYLAQSKDPLPENGRFFAESFFGSIIPKESSKAIHMYGNVGSCLQIEDFVTNYLQPLEDRQLYPQVVASL